MYVQVLAYWMFEMFLTLVHVVPSGLTSIGVQTELSISFLAWHPWCNYGQRTLSKDAARVLRSTR